MLTLDPTNRRILNELARDCRMSFQKLAGKVGLSTTAVIRRVSSLIEDGTIMKFRVIPSQAMTGVSKFAAIVHTDGTENADDLVDLIGTNRGVIQVSELITTAGRSYFVTGEFIGSKRLQEIRRSLSSLDSARDVEIHATIRTMVPEGTRMDVSRHQLLVLRAMRGCK
ncbi:MAG: Lrp/AsnC family transcriptional regulator [Candidatus Sifarchaeia archaeon]